MRIPLARSPSSNHFLAMVKTVIVLIWHDLSSTPTVNNRLRLSVADPGGEIRPWPPHRSWQWSLVPPWGKIEQWQYCEFDETLRILVPTFDVGYGFAPPPRKNATLKHWKGRWLKKRSDCLCNGDLQQPSLPIYQMVQKIEYTGHPLFGMLWISDILRSWIWRGFIFHFTDCCFQQFGCQSLQRVQIGFPYCLHDVTSHQWWMHPFASNR